jgi:4-hydroxy-tetrahydrodipicolinate synthase
MPDTVKEKRRCFAMPVEIKGLFVATVTPYKEDGLVDLQQVEQHVKYLAKKRIGGLVCNAHAGEGELLTRQEKIDVIEAIRNRAGIKLPLVAGVEALRTDDLVEQARDARKAGADAVMLCAPPLFAWNASLNPEFGEGQIRAVADEVDVPIILFQYSSNNPFYYAPKDLHRIVQQVKKIVAVKLATNLNMAQYEEDLRAIKSVDRTVSALPAAGLTLYYALLAGADGALSGSANFAAEHDVEMLEAVQAGDMAKGLEIHKTAYHLFKEVYKHPYANMHIRYKYCTYMAGLISNPLVRRPLLPLPLKEITLLAEGMKNSGVPIINKDLELYSRERLIPWWSV